MLTNQKQKTAKLSELWIEQPIGLVCETDWETKIEQLRGDEREKTIGWDGLTRQTAGENDTRAAASVKVREQLRKQPIDWLCVGPTQRQNVSRQGEKEREVCCDKQVIIIRVNECEEYSSKNAWPSD